MSKLSKREITGRVRRAVETCSGTSRAIRRSDTLVGTLGFDSLRMAALAIELEEELGQPLLLVDWIGAQRDPTALTFGSLCDYLGELVDAS